MILDINLPGISAFERLQAWPETSEDEFFRYLTKPVELDALTAALTAAVS